MKSSAITVEKYIKELPEERKSVIEKLRNIILENMPVELSEGMSYGMIGYVVPHSVYPKGYHVKPELPLPFLNLASQKNYISFYHFGLYEDTSLLNWFQKEYPKYSKYKLDMGKCCVRFKRLNDVPYDLIAQLLRKITVSEFIEGYEKTIRKSRNQ